MQTKKLKILVIQLRQLGDVLMTTPLVRQLKHIYPNCELHFLTEKLGSAVYEHNKNVDKIIILPRKMSLWELAKSYQKIHAAKYDIVVDCFCNPKSAQLTFFSRAAKRIGFHFQGRKYAYNNIDVLKDAPKEHINDYSATTKLRLIEHLGANILDNEIEFPIDEALKKYAADFFAAHFSGKKVVSFNVISRKDYKIFNFEHYIKVANWLVEQGFFLFFTFGPGEKELAKKVYDGMQQPHEALIEYPMPRIGELKALLEQCEFYVGNDGGIKHIAVCAGLPTFTIFQNINWANWTPPQSEAHVALTNYVNEIDFLENHSTQEMAFLNLSDVNIIPLLRGFIQKNKRF